MAIKSTVLLVFSVPTPLKLFLLTEAFNAMCGMGEKLILKVVVFSLPSKYLPYSPFQLKLSFLEPSLDQNMVYAGLYPLTRPLYQYTNGVPEGKTKTFLEFENSPAGKKIILENGYLSAREAGLAGNLEK